jgi:expansin (peptidoglycan-binding protein)
MAVQPAEGYAFRTTFAVTAVDWQDVDAPLWFQLKYRVVGGNSSAWTALSSPAPVKNINTVLPVAGLAAFNHRVSLQLSVADRLGAVATTVVNVTVRLNVSLPRPLFSPTPLLRHAPS